MAASKYLHRVDLVVVNPVLVVGPLLQPIANASIVHILKYLTGSAKTYANSVQTCVHVRDVDLAHILDYETPTSGSIEILGLGNYYGYGIMHSYKFCIMEKHLACIMEKHLAGKFLRAPNVQELPVSLRALITLAQSPSNKYFVLLNLLANITATSVATISASSSPCALNL
ncbi:hypothetical protein IFM89_036305 [Coptis chinensis]|uniref:Cinnamoyl-CoA reductase n=1 Tax=Coptis chinensis TaxID=261450 RepID=A0A835IHQ3_9MAGN|nr:hypothetical protein IFM89_036305 [Coptis chinensis]